MKKFLFLSLISSLSLFAEEILPIEDVFSYEEPKLPKAEETSDFYSVDIRQGIRKDFMREGSLSPFITLGGQVKKAMGSLLGQIEGYYGWNVQSGYLYGYSRSFREQTGSAHISLGWVRSLREDRPGKTDLNTFCGFGYDGNWVKYIGKNNWLGPFVGVGMVIKREKVQFEWAFSHHFLRSRYYQNMSFHGAEVFFADVRTFEQADKVKMDLSYNVVENWNVGIHTDGWISYRIPGTPGYAYNYVEGREYSYKDKMSGDYRIMTSVAVATTLKF